MSGRVHLTPCSGGSGGTLAPVMAEPTIKVGDLVEPLDVAGEVRGVVLELLDDATIARVEWTTGKGLAGKRTLIRVSQLRKRAR